MKETARFLGRGEREKVAAAMIRQHEPTHDYRILTSTIVLRLGLRNTLVHCSPEALWLLAFSSGSCRSWSFKEFIGQQASLPSGSYYLHSSSRMVEKPGPRIRMSISCRLSRRRCLSLEGPQCRFFRKAEQYTEFNGSC